MKTSYLLFAAGMAFLTTSLLSPVFVAGGAIPPVGEFGGPFRPLTAFEAAQFLRGRALFDEPMHKSRGLGTPDYNADSCRACHQDPVIGGAGGLELNVSRAANDNGGAGPFTNITGGQAFSKFRPPWIGGREDYDPIEADVFEQRQTPALFGMGLIDTISDAEILSNQDPNDTNGDRIFGVARMVDVGGGVMEVGRFGWKGQVPHTRDFVRDAMAGELGLTTPDDGRGFALAADADAVADPEFLQTEIDDMEFWLNLLAPPPRGGNGGDMQVMFGKRLFGAIGCGRCHMPKLQGANGPVFLYSDLLLHDIYRPLFRGMDDPGAPTAFYQTPPLWGISKTAPYLHDGRAETLADAIDKHYGEAARVRHAYTALPLNLRQAIILFLEDL
jgi:CxxC motif-containing protein (DUF1111 family)